MRIEQNVTIDASRERVWELIRDPAGYAGLLEWADFAPVEGSRGVGIGARYEMHLQVGSATVGGVVEIVEYDPLGDIAWTSVTGVEQRGRLRVRSESAGRTRLTMRFSYGAPGALLGTLAELMSVRQVNASVERSLRNVIYEAEGRERPPLDGPSLPRRLLRELDNIRIIANAGVFAPIRPDRAASIAVIGARWRASLATGVLIGAVRHPERTMIVDELGPLTYREVDVRTNALASGLRAEGIQAGDRVVLMCRNHRGFVESVVALAKIGVDTLVLDTSLAAAGLSEICRREDVVALLHDEEFTGVTEQASRGRRRFVAWHEQGGPAARTLAELVADGPRSPLPPPPRAGRVTFLTFGPTGTLHGALRASAPMTLDLPAAVLDRIPLREGQVTSIGAPLCRTWGIGNLALGMALGSTFVLRRKLHPEQCLNDIEQHRCTVLAADLVMLQRILALPSQDRQRYDTGSLCAVCASGSSLSDELSTRWMDEFGDHLYNIYGSTEFASATVATPQDLRRAPGTAGKPVRGSVVRLYDDRNRPVLQGRTGRIFVGSRVRSDGCSGGGGKDRIDGLLATGDLGWFDEAGRLFVEDGPTR
jgi:fatty-acyl-CoA synthase